MGELAITTRASSFGSFFVDLFCEGGRAWIGFPWEGMSENERGKLCMPDAIGLGALFLTAHKGFVF